MKEEWEDIQDLMQFLGYSDERSVKKWCKKRNIPILIAGLNKYVSKHLLTQYIDNQLVIFVKGNEAIENLPKKIESVSKNRDKRYIPENEIINKYLLKYESDAKSKTSRQRPT